jgi:hypothetical protein
MGWWLKNRVEIEIMVFLLIGVGLLTGVGSPTPWRGGGECLVTIISISIILSMWDKSQDRIMGFSYALRELNLQENRSNDNSQQRC